MAQSQKGTAMNLFQAAKEGKVATLRRLISGGADVNALARGRDSDLGYATQSGTALMGAAEGGHVDACRLLLDAGAKVNIRNANGSTALAHAAAPGHEAVVRMLLEAGAKVDTPDQQGRTALLVAAYGGHAEVVQALLDAGADPNHKDSGNHTSVLTWAASQRNHEVVRRLVKAGAKLEIRDKFGNTPLTTAVEYGDLAMVRLLLRAGADVRARNEAGYTALMHAATPRKAAAARLLLRHGADVNAATTNFGETPLMSAASDGSVPLVRLFLKAGADINRKDRDGEGTLWRAVDGGHVGLVRFLVKAGADVNAKTKDGRTPLALAAEKGDKRLFELLQGAGARGRETGPTKDLREEALRQAAAEGDLRRVRESIRMGVDLNARKPDASPPLWQAANKGHLEVVRVLLDAGAQVDLEGEYDSTPLHKAAERGHAEVVRVLIAAGADVNAQYDRCMADTYTGWTALMAAAEDGSRAMVRDLLAAGADPNARTVLDFTPLLLAVEERNHQAAQTLCSSGAQVDHCAMHFLKVLDFAGAARRPDFRSAAEELGKVCGVKPRKSRDFPDGALYDLGRSRWAARLKPRVVKELTAECLAEGEVEDEAETRKAALGLVAYCLPDRVAAEVLEDVQEKFLHRGYYVVGAKLGIGTEWLALLPSDDRYAVVACLGPNSGGGTPYLIGWLKELAREQSFELAGCGYDTLKIRFTQRVREPERLARRVFRLGPTNMWRPDEIGVLVGGKLTQTEHVKDLADALREKRPTLRLWWD
jgi:ankyrin repeat protein